MATRQCTRPARTPPPCQFDGCERSAWAKRYCMMHYQFAIRNGLLPRPRCKADGCEHPRWVAGYCNAHYLLARKYGDPNTRRAAAKPGECCRRVCEADGCDAQGMYKVAGAVYCGVHGDRARRNGDPFARKKLGNGEATPERLREQRRKAMARYYKTPHGRMRARFASAKRRVLAGKATGAGTITKAQFLALWNTPDCAICGHPMGDDRTIDHLVPLSKGGDNTLGNLRMAHRLCNMRKSDKMPPVPPPAVTI